MKLPPESRARRILARLDERLDRQTILTRISPENLARCSLLAGRFHSVAGHYERRVLPFANDLPLCDVSLTLRQLRSLLATRSTFCEP